MWAANAKWQDYNVDEQAPKCTHRSRRRLQNHTQGKQQTETESNLDRKEKPPWLELMKMHAGNRWRSSDRSLLPDMAMILHSTLPVLHLHHRPPLHLLKMDPEQYEALTLDPGKLGHFGMKAPIQIIPVIGPTLTLGKSFECSGRTTKHLSVSL